MGKRGAKSRSSRYPIDAFADRVAVIDLQGRILDVNQALLDFHGRRREEIVGHSFLDLVAGEEQERMGRFLRELIESEAFAIFEMKTLLPDGRETHSEIMASIVRDESDRPRAIVVVTRDISRRKEAERRLAESEEMYRALLDNIHEAVYKIDEAGILKFISAGIERVTGYTPAEIVGRNFVEFIYPEDVEFIRGEFQQLAENHLQPSEYRIVHKNGEPRWISSSSRPIFVAGEFRGITGVLSDINERKLAQQALQRQQELLREAQQLEAIGTLAGGIAHDFNNLLTGVQGRVSLMLMDSDAATPHHGYLKEIESLVNSAAELTRQLLGLARGGKYEARPSDLNELIRRTADMFGRTRKEITISTLLEPRLWTIEIDRTQVEQVLLNLLMNAWQAMPRGGLIAVESRNLELHEDDTRAFQLRSGRFVRVAVSDSGIGMDEKTRSRVFDPFFTTKEMGRGTGLGLAAAYGIVKNHGGVITVYSEKGRGSTFHVYLPASAKTVEKTIETEEELIGGHETILLVDDEEMILDVARQMLESLGYRVFSAANGAQALKVFRDKRGEIAMIILDMIMPQMSGGKVFEILKEIDPRARILLSSGYSINGQAMEIMRRGCRGFIQKPFSIKDLAFKLREVLDK